MKDNEGEEIPTTPQAFAEYKMRKLTPEQFLDEYKTGGIPIPDDVLTFATKLVIKLILGVFEKRNKLKARVEKLELQVAELQKQGKKGKGQSVWNKPTEEGLPTLEEPPTQPKDDIDIKPEN